MHIAYICGDAGVPIFGQKGASVHVQEVIRAMIGLGAQVDIFATSGEGTPSSDWARVRVHRLPSLPKGDLATRERAALASNVDLFGELDKAGPYDLVYERFALWCFAGMEYAHAVGVPGLLEVNAPLIEEQAKHRGLVDRKGAELAAGRALSAATAVAAVSAEVAAYLERFQADRDRIHVVPNAVDPDRFPPELRPSRPGEPGTFTIGFVGTLKPWHGLQSLVEAFSMFSARVGHVRLLVVGDGPERRRMEHDLNGRGLHDATVFVGAVPPGAVPGMLASMDIAVAPYPAGSDFYFSPLKVYEYMAAGLPVVASRIGQLQEVVDDGVNGLLCDPDDSVALAQAFELLYRNEALRVRMGRAARETVLRRHTWKETVRRLLKIVGCGEIPAPTRATT